LMEWMMILVTSSSSNSSIKHTAAAIKENGCNNTATTGFGIWMATRVEVGGDEGWSWQGGLKLKRNEVGY
jgi:hypothetical protein